MCGIFGVIVSGTAAVSTQDVFGLFTALGTASQTRGVDGSGLMATLAGQSYVHRSPDPFERLAASQPYRNLVSSMAERPEALRGGGMIIGHARLATHGSQGVESNNQPVGHSNLYCLHNGIVVNAPALWQELLPWQPHTEVDSEVIPALVSARLQTGVPWVQAVAESVARLKGEFSVALADASTGHLVLATNTGSLYHAFDAERGLLVFASERFIVDQVLKAHPRLFGARVAAKQLPIGHLIAVPRGPLAAPVATAYNAAPTAAAAPAAAVSPKLVVHDTLLDAIKRSRELRRCTRCVLPETMPYIQFDRDGVCNYCRNYRSKQLLGEARLEELLSRHRSKDGSPDCVIAFSGGRDSSYALHLLTRKYGMHPIAYTYDWGMVTDLARRNQARMCGQLGIEHIWISADIVAKRRNIGANVRAWMHKPALGMIPLFMAGDKQFFYHGHRTMKQTGNQLMVFATNHYEKTDFKIGFCGIPPVTDQDRPNYLNFGRKLALVRYYLGQFLSNPRYLNRSLIDTMGAFWSYYGLDNEATFLHLFDYVPWDEEEIDRTLIGEYEWETAPDSTSTWRIGDGTAALYNYIYRIVCGFSEQETFRSNQIREGIITRERALALVEAESAPRFESIEAYCGLIGVPFSELLSAIYRLPRLY